MRLYLFISIFVMFIFPSGKTQTHDGRAQKILESVAKRITSATDVRWTFTLSISYPDETSREFSGKYFQRANHFRLDMPEYLIACDGSTQWNVDRSGKEITIYDYEDPGQDDLTNPSNLLNIYNHPDFDYFLDFEGNQKGLAIKRFEFKPLKSNSDIFKIRLEVLNTNDIHAAEVFYKNGIKYYLNIEETHLNTGLSPALFSIDPESYPGFHVEDLRF